MSEEKVNRKQDNPKNGKDTKYAVEAAVDSCIEDGIMSSFLTRHKTEVFSACLAEFEEETFANRLRKEGKIKEKAVSILEFLEDFGTVPEILRTLIMEQTDLEILREWLKIAARVEAIEDFEEKTGLVKEIK